MKFLVLLPLLLIACSPGINMPAINVDPVGAEHTAEVTYQEDRAVVDIHSIRGIGRALITKAEDQWPPAIEVRLHLKALEHFSVSDRKNQVSVSVNSRRIKDISCTTGPENNISLMSCDAMWMPVQLVPAPGLKPAIPLEGGYFSVILPDAMVKKNPVVLRINWVDWYR